MTCYICNADEKAKLRFLVNILRSGCWNMRYYSQFMGHRKPILSKKTVYYFPYGPAWRADIETQGRYDPYGPTVI